MKKVTTQAEFDEAIKSAKAAGGGKIYLSKGSFRINEAIPPTIELIGEQANPPQMRNKERLGL